MSGAWSQASIKTEMAACIGRYVRDIPATSSTKVIMYFIFRGTTKYSWAFECTKAVKTMNIDRNGHIVLCLTVMEGQESLTLRWETFSRWGIERFSFSFAYKGSQWFVYDCLQRVARHITQDTRPTIVDAPFTLIFKMGKRVFLFLFCLLKQPMIRLWLFATCCTPYYTSYIINNCWRNIDAKFQDGAQSVSLSHLPINAANDLCMTVWYMSHPILPRIHDQQPLTLHWCTFSRLGRKGITIWFAYRGSQ